MNKAMTKQDCADCHGAGAWEIELGIYQMCPRCSPKEAVDETRQLKLEHARMQEALKFYRDTFCEGMEGCGQVIDLDCSGCRAKLVLETIKNER